MAHAIRGDAVRGDAVRGDAVRGDAVRGDAGCSAPGLTLSRRRQQNEAFWGSR